MIDLHCHILAGVDDGPARLEQSLEMARVAAADGIGDIVATPHGSNIDYDPGRDEPLTKDEISGKVSWLERQIAAAGLDVKIYPGMEIYLSPETLASLDTGLAFGLNGTHYLLVELPFEHYPRYADDVIFKLQVKGYTPIVAHPERCSAIRENPELLFGLVRKGCLVQVTAASLLGQFGGKVKESTALLLRHNLAHVIATDAHGIGRRDPLLSAAVEEATMLIGKDRALPMVTSTPACIIAGECVETPEPCLPGKRHFFFGIGR